MTSSYKINSINHKGLSRSQQASRAPPCPAPSCPKVDTPAWATGKSTQGPARAEDRLVAAHIIWPDMFLARTILDLIKSRMSFVSPVDLDN